MRTAAERPQRTRNSAIADKTRDAFRDILETF